MNTQLLIYGALVYFAVAGSANIICGMARVDKSRDTEYGNLETFVGFLYIIFLIFVVLT